MLSSMDLRASCDDDCLGKYDLGHVCKQAFMEPAPCRSLSKSVTSAGQMVVGMGPNLAFGNYHGPDREAMDH